jgi:prepilin-type N-terminal cleavage/methylation domain
MQKNNGFTLIELMVTIAVMAIIAMLAAPSFGDMIVRQNLKKSTNELIGVLNQTRAKAVLERRKHRCQFKFKRNRCIAYRYCHSSELDASW